MKLPVGIAVFVIFYLGILVFMVRGNAKNRELIKEIVNTVSSSFILVSIFMLVYNEYLKNEETKKKRVTELNSVNNQLLESIYGLFLQNPATLHKLHREIFQSPQFKNSTNKTNGVDNQTLATLSYHEYIALQIIFTIILNIYRQYIISGGEQDMMSKDLYESLDILISQTTQSPKAITFWNENKQQFESLGFIRWMENKYFK
jgi:hypothetical protein